MAKLLQIDFPFQGLVGAETSSARLRSFGIAARKAKLFENNADLTRIDHGPVE